jgi:iron complex transport system substrate-binding protein
MKRIHVAAACTLLAIVIGLLIKPRVFVPAHKPSGMRIVSLAPSVTEILFAAGMGDSVVGVTSFCDYPPEAKHIERVGGLGSPNIEKLLALSPSLVIGTDLRRDGASDLLWASSIPVLELRIRSFRELFAAFEKVGRATGRSERAREMVVAMQKELDGVSSRYGGISPKNRPRVFVEIWGDPLTTAGATSFLDEMIRRAGGINVAQDLPQEYPRVNPEMVVQWNPDVIVTCYMGRTGPAAADFTKRIGWSDIVAVRHGRIITDFPAELLLRPGPRLIRGVYLLAERLHNDSSAQAAVQGQEQ